MGNLARLRDAAVVWCCTGQGVIGKYPQLQAGGEVFSYQSCNRQPTGVGYMEGSFK